MAGGPETKDFAQVLRDLFRREHASRCLVQGCHFADSDSCAYCGQPKPADGSSASDRPSLKLDSVAAKTTMAFPQHQCSLTLEHNPQKAIRQTVAQWLDDADLDSAPTWPSPEERQQAIDSNELWVLTWHPHTPIGFHWVAATTLEAVLICAHLKGND